MTLEAEVAQFYDRYLSCWNARAFDDVAACFAQPALFVLPSGAVSLPDSTAMVAMLQSLFARMEADGFSHTTVGSMTVRPCGTDLAVLDVSEICRWRGDGSLIEKIDGHYVLQRSDEVWRATVALTCDPGWRG